MDEHLLDSKTIEPSLKQIERKIEIKKSSLNNKRI